MKALTNDINEVIMALTHSQSLELNQALTHVRRKKKYQKSKKKNNKLIVRLEGRGSVAGVSPKEAKTWLNKEGFGDAVVSINKQGKGGTAVFVEFKSVEDASMLIQHIKKINPSLYSESEEDASADADTAEAASSEEQPTFHDIYAETKADFLVRNKERSSGFGQNKKRDVWNWRKSVDDLTEEEKKKSEQRMKTDKGRLSYDGLAYNNLSIRGSLKAKKLDETEGTKSRPKLKITKRTKGSIVELRFSKGPVDDDIGFHFQRKGHQNADAVTPAECVQIETEDPAKEPEVAEKE